MIRKHRHIDRLERSLSSQALHLEVAPYEQLHFHTNDGDTASMHKHHNQAAPKIGRLVLVRHGQSEWNVTDPARNLTARFVSSFCSEQD
jgi:hypothetical protein